MALARGHGLDRPRRRGQLDGPRRVHARDDRRRAGRALAEPAAEERGGRLWLPFTRDGRRARCWRPAAPAWTRALRCASRLQVDLEPAPATLSLVEGYGELRFKLDVNWDPETLPAFLELPACEAHGRTLPVDPYLLEPLEHYLRVFGVDAAPNAREVLDKLRGEHDAAIDDVRRSRALDAALAGPRRRLGGELRPFQRAGVDYVLQRAADVPGRRAGPRQDRPGARRAGGRRRLPGGGRLPGGPEAQLAARDRALAAAPLGDVVNGTGVAPMDAEITVLNYEIVHAHRVRLQLRRPKALVLDESHYVKNPRAKRTQAVRRLAEALPGARCSSRSPARR